MHWASSESDPMQTALQWGLQGTSDRSNDDSSLGMKPVPLPPVAAGPLVFSRKQTASRLLPSWRKGQGRKGQSKTFFLRFIQLFFKFYLFIYSFSFGCVGSSFLCEGFLQLRQAGATLHRSAQASHYRGLSCCGAQAPDAQAQQLWLTGPVTPRHVGSSQARARTRVPCAGRQTLNHCATGEAPSSFP